MAYSLYSICHVCSNATHMWIFSYTGQFFCGNKRCENKEGLKSWEVNFAYVEHEEKRNALLKLRKCQSCETTCPSKPCML